MTRIEKKEVTLIILAFGNFAQLGTRFIIAALVPLILTNFNATKSSIGLALTGMWMMYALFQLPSGVLAGRFGERQILLLGLIGGTIGALFISISPSLILFGIFCVILGSGTGLYYSPASLLISRLFEEHGRALSVLTSIGTIAGIAYPALGSTIGVKFGWRSSIAFTAIITFVMTVLVFVKVPFIEPEGTNKFDFNFKRYKELLTRPKFLLSLVIACGLMFVTHGFASFYPTFLVEFHNFDPAKAGIIFGLMFGFSSVGQLGVGKLSDIVSRDISLVLSALLAMSGYIIVLVYTKTIIVIAGSVLLGSGLSWPGVIQAKFIDQLSIKERGYGFGFARTLYLLIASSSSVVVGSLAEYHGWIVGYSLSVAILGGCLVLIAINILFS